MELRRDAAPGRPPWPKLQATAAELPMAERIARYRANILAIRSAGYPVPSALDDTTDPVAIEAWLHRHDTTLARLRRVIHAVSRLPSGTTLPCPF